MNPRRIYLVKRPVNIGGAYWLSIVGQFANPLATSNAKPAFYNFAWAHYINDLHLSDQLDREIGY